ncbi:MAG: PucR family transcriptional regulator [Streptosporangiales bacterium]|nr:PucR family transcriptional regulator [Streptosporangiales bacterium]
MVKLDRLINVLGGYGARVIGSGRARDIELRSVVLHDPTEDAPALGDAFLAVGVASVSAALDLAAAAHAVVAVVRDDADPGADVVAAVRERGIALLVVDPAVSWSQISEVVHGLVFEGRETESGRGPIDLFALADTVAAGVGGAVTIEDQRSHVLAYSGQQDVDPARLETILARRMPAELRALLEERGVFTHLTVSDEPLFVRPSEEHGLHGRTVVAVRAGRELLGSVWVTCDAPLSSERSQALANGAHTVALHLLRSRVSADLERQVESELVSQLLEGTSDAAVVIGRLGLPPGQFRVIALQAHRGSEHHAVTLLAFERATTGFGWSRPGRSTLFGNTVYTVLPCDDDVAAARQWVADLVRNLPRDVTVAAGIGGAADPGELPAGRREADECLALHAAMPDAQPVSYEESWDEILLHRLRTAAATGRTPARGPIADLARHDAANATQYVPTLRAWLEAQGDLGFAAALLDVHPNTIRYRMRKMTDVANLQLDDPRKRLAMLVSLAVDRPAR